MRRFLEIIEGSREGVVILYHITANPRFKLDPDYAPEDNSTSIFDRSGQKGIYLCRSVETWVNGHGYIRPFVAEIEADPSVIERDTVGRWGGEVFVPASDFDKLRVVRVIPLDALCREEYGEHGWLESSLDREFDTDNELPKRNWNEPWRPAFPDGYRYEHDVRELPDEEVERLRQHQEAGHQARLKYR